MDRKSAGWTTEKKVKALPARCCRVILQDKQKESRPKSKKIQMLAQGPVPEL